MLLLPTVQLAPLPGSSHSEQGVGRNLIAIVYLPHARARDEPAFTSVIIYSAPTPRTPVLERETKACPG